MNMPTTLTRLLARSFLPALAAIGMMLASSTAVHAGAIVVTMTMTSDSSEGGTSPSDNLTVTEPTLPINVNQNLAESNTEEQLFVFIVGYQWVTPGIVKFDNAGSNEYDYLAWFNIPGNAVIAAVSDGDPTTPTYPNLPAFVGFPQVQTATSIPEPSTLLLLGVGSLGLLGCARSRRRPARESA